MDLGQQGYNGNTISPVLPDGVKNYVTSYKGKWNKMTKKKFNLEVFE
jgi:hypothetical protein